MRRNHTSAGYETYKFKMTIIENGVLEELLQFLMNAKKDTKGTGTGIFTGRIKFLCTILSGEAFQ